MRHLVYLGLLAGCLLGTLPLEVVLGVRVYRQWRRLALAVVPLALVFVGWDLLAIHYRWWTFDRRYLTGWFVGGGLPVEEVLFFLVVPVCAVLTLEAVRRVKPRWLDDES